MRALLPTLLSFLLLLTASQDRSMAWLSQVSITKQDASCLVYFGVKKVFIHGTKDYLYEFGRRIQFLKTNFPVLPDAHIYIYSIQYSPSAILTDFSTNVNVTQYDTVWLEPYTSNMSCQFLETYIYYCDKLKLNCGFSMYQDDWFKIVGEDRMGCKEAAKLPLMYREGPEKFRPMGGWNSYKYATTNTSINYCYSIAYNLTIVEKSPKGELKVEDS